MPRDVKLEDILAEVEDVLRTMPNGLTTRSHTPEDIAWIGRAVAAVAYWNSVLGASARSHADNLQDPHGAISHKGYTGLLTLLNECRSDLRLSTLGPVNVAIGKGLVFDYFDEIRQQIIVAKAELLFIDPYLDADFVSRYLSHVPSGVSMRLLARERLSSLIPAVKLFAQQTGRKVEVRSAPNFHDRYMIVDGIACFQSGASFKDGGRNAPTTITQITDAFQAVRQTYENLWQSGNIEL
jgi:hypothetical protein